MTGDTPEPDPLVSTDRSGALPGVPDAAERLHALRPFVAAPDEFRGAVRAALPAAEQQHTAPLAAGPVIQHDHTGTIVTGTSKDDTTLRAALNDTGFRWSGQQSFWYLPRTLNQHTRQARVSDLRSQLAANGRDLPSADAAAAPRSSAPDTTRPAADPGPAVPLRRLRDL